MSSVQLECLAQKTLGDDVAGTFTQNAPMTPGERFVGGIADFSDDFVFYNADQPKADANWVPNDSTKMRVNVSSDLLDFNAVVDATNDAISFDLWAHGIFPDDETWTLRFELNLTSIVPGLLGGDVYIGVTNSDHTVASSTAGQKSIGIDFLQATGPKQWNGGARDGNIPVGGGTSPLPILGLLPTATVMYFEIRRTSLTSYIATRYTDSTYTVPMAVSKESGFVSTITGLRYIKITNRLVSSTGSIVGTIDNVQFFNKTEGQVDHFILHETESTPLFSDNFNIYSNAVNADFTEDFDTSTGWTTTDSTRMRVEDDQGFLFAMAVADNSNDAIAFDLGATVNPGPNIVDDEEWTLRFKASITKIDDGADPAEKTVFIGLFDEDQTSGAANSQDGLYLAFVIDNTPTRQFSLGVVDAQTPDVKAFEASSPLGFLTTTLYFAELKRTSSTTYDFAIYSDSSYSNQLLRFSGTFGGAEDPINLRYLKIFNNESENGSGSLDITIDDVQFWDGRSTTCNLSTFFEDFSTSTNWTEFGTGLFTITGGELVWDSTNDAQNQGLSRDLLSPVSDDGWQLRGKIDVQNINSGSNSARNKIFIGLADANGNTDSDTAKDWIGFNIEVNDTVKQFRVQATNNASPNDDAGTTFFSGFSESIVYFQLKRNSQTSARLDLFSDPNFTNLLATQDFVTSSSITGLQYIVIQNGQGNPGSDSTLDGVIDDLDFYNSQIWADSGTNNFVVELCQRNIQFDAISASNDGIVYDLGSALDNSKWAMRFDVIFQDLVDGTATNMFIGMSDSDESAGADDSQAYIMARLQFASGQKTISGISDTTNQPNAEPRDDQQNFTLLEGVKYYFEIIRRSSTEYNVIMYSDENYTFPLTISNCTVSAGVTGLRYVKCLGIHSNLATGDMIGQIDNVKIWDGVDNADGFANRVYYQFLGNINEQGTVEGQQTFNLNQDGKYSERKSLNGAADTVLTSQDCLIPGLSASDVQQFIPEIIYNQLDEEKLIIAHPFTNLFTGAAAAPIRNEYVGKWAITDSVISRVGLKVGVGGGMFEIGSSMAIFGAD
jgi:hypothetical protein